jgi:hypothetical protein
VNAISVILGIEIAKLKSSTEAAFRRGETVRNRKLTCRRNRATALRVCVCVCVYLCMSTCVGVPIAKAKPSSLVVNCSGIFCAASDSRVRSPRVCKLAVHDGTSVGVHESL